MLHKHLLLVLLLRHLPNQITLILFFLIFCLFLSSSTSVFSLRDSKVSQLKRLFRLNFEWLSSSEFVFLV